MLPRPKTIYVDVDGTLILKNGTVNTHLINFLENMSEANGGDYQLILWSMAGHAHAETVAEELNITRLFEHILTKPGYMIDDDGKNWLRFTHLITPEFYKNKFPLLTAATEDSSATDKSGNEADFVTKPNPFDRLWNQKWSVKPVVDYGVQLDTIASAHKGPIR